MKKNIKIIFLIIVLVTGLTTLHFSYGLFTPYNYLTAKRDIAADKPRILQFGEATQTDLESKAMAPKYGFNYHIIAGCAVTIPLINGVEAYNSVTTDYLNNKLGNDWKKKYDFQVDSLFRENRVDTIRKTILAIEKVKSLNQYLDSVSGGKEHLFIWISPQIKDDPNVKVGRMMPDSSIMVLDYYQVDLYSLLISEVQY